MPISPFVNEALRKGALLYCLGIVLALAAPAAAGSRALSSRTVVPSFRARQIAAQWGGSVTYLPTWAPRGVVLGHWSSGTCACGTDDNLLTVTFAHRATKLSWEITDDNAYQVDRVRERVSCDPPDAASRLVAGRTVFVRARPRSTIAWMCISVKGGWEPKVALHRLMISLSETTGGTGVLSPPDLMTMLASAKPSPAGRAAGSSYELPPRSDVRSMASVFPAPFFLPTGLPNGFIYSGWNVSTSSYSGPHAAVLDFGRDGLFTQVLWNVHWGTEKAMYDDCVVRSHWTPRAIINGQKVYVIEGIHGVGVFTCIGKNTIANTQPIEISIWYDIRLHNPSMLRWAERMVANPHRVS
jgi:hypothetical protein